MASTVTYPKGVRTFPLAQAFRLCGCEGVYAALPDGRTVWISPKLIRAGTVYRWEVCTEFRTEAESAYWADYRTPEACAEALFTHIGQRVERWVPGGRYGY